METRTKNKRWATVGLVAGMMIGGGALANAATRSQSAPTPTVQVVVPAPKVSAPAPQPSAVDPSTEAPGTETPDAADATEAPEAAGTEAKDAAEADGGVDCENGTVKGTGAQCDGGPSANQDDGTEVTTDANTPTQK